MADYYPLIARAVSGLENNTVEARKALYSRAREILAKQIPDQTSLARELASLDKAIGQVEADAAPAEQVRPAQAGPLRRPTSMTRSILYAAAAFLIVAMAAFFYYRTTSGSFAPQLSAIFLSPPKASPDKSPPKALPNASPAKASPKKSVVPAQFSETELSAYKKDASGGFSPYWVAYIVTPEKEAADRSSFVDLNGKRLGPYSNVSGLIDFSRDGKHIAFAAEKNGKWTIVIDAVEKFTQDALVWPWSAWSPTLEGNSFIPQTRAAAMKFSPDGRSLAYPAQTADGKYAVFVDGHPGPSYPDIGGNLSFVAGRIKYYAFPADKKIVEVHGDQVLGPYDASYLAKVSPDGNHYILWAKRGDKTVVVVDDKESELPGELADYAIGDGGIVAYAYKNSGKFRVRIGTADLPGDYDEIADLAISPDGKKLAFWARVDSKWTVVAGDKELPGYDGRFFYMSGGAKYSVMWSPDSQHIAYYVSDHGGGALVLDGQKLEKAFAPPGIALQNIVDARGRTVGLGLMSGPQMDTEAFVQAIVSREKTKCDPFSTVLWGEVLSCVEKAGAASYMIVGEKREGPFQSIKSKLLTPDGGKHYAYVVQTEQGQRLVVDGAVTPHVYDAMYRPAFDEDGASLALLAVKDGKLWRVVQPLQAP